ncbi:hypothetical protein MANES_04G001901v8 [Manihot esculenta]|uniref:Uncharacterized protein n=1 Tax=Manihot esculenta TaxID=3983 RepID=A0ACB7HRF3_MANES|nr:hypothetical protein MANES_04G001901v8 [Manihot esculenta]
MNCINFYSVKIRADCPARTRRSIVFHVGYLLSVNGLLCLCLCLCFSHTPLTATQLDTYNTRSFRTTDFIWSLLRQHQW